MVDRGREGATPARRPALLIESLGDHLHILRGALAIFIANKIAFVDAVILATARHNGWHLETFDKTLSKLAAK